MRTEQINVSLTPELAKFLKDKVKSGLYNSVSEAVRELVREQKLRDARRRKVQKSLQEGLAAGRLGVLPNPETVARTLADFEEEDEETIAAVREGFTEIERGEGIEISNEDELKQFFKNLRTQARREFAAECRDGRKAGG